VILNYLYLILFAFLGVLLLSYPGIPLDGYVFLLSRRQKIIIPWHSMLYFLTKFGFNAYVRMNMSCFPNVLDSPTMYPLIMYVI